MNKLPEKLVDLRKHYSYSQSYIAELLGVDVLVYMRYENGSSLPKFDELKVLARFYKVPIETLFINDRKMDLEKYEAYDIDRDNYQYLQMMAKKQKWSTFVKQHKTKLIVIAVLVFILLGMLVSLLFDGSSDLSITRTASPSDLLDASDTTVVYLDDEGNVYGRGDNTYSQIDFDFTDIVAVAEGDTFTVALKSDGTVVSAGLISRISQELDALTNIVAVAAGNDHIVTLDQSGRVSCVGDNSYGQCEIDGSRNIVSIFADGDATIAIDSEGNILSYGSFYGSDEVTELDGLIDIAISDEISAFVDGSGDLYYYSSGQEFSEAAEFSDVIQVAVGDNFIAVLDSSGNVSIDIEENYLIGEEVATWENVSAIAAGKDYLVALIDGEIVGVGNNTYDQFDVEESQKISLASVSNVQISFEDDEIVITFDEVANATAYDLVIDVGMGIAVTSTENRFTIPIDQFEDGTQYTIQITAIGDGQRYDDSAASIVNYLFVDPSTLEETESEGLLFTLDQLVGQTKASFEAYLAAFGVPEENMTGLVNEALICAGDTEIITSVEGISDREELTLEDLLSREITYYYCVLMGGEEDVAD